MNDFHHIQPDVPDVIRDQASPIERYLLDLASVASQQNRSLHSTLEAVLKQTTATNGRVTALEKEAADTRKVVSTIKRVRAWVVGSIAVAAPVLYVIAEKAINYVWP